MKHNITVEYNHVLLRPLHESDLESLRVWRNDANNSKFLRRLDYISSQIQLKWFEQDNLDVNCYTFAIEETQTLKQLVGSVALYNLEDDTSEFGRMLIGDTKAHGRGIGFLGTVLLLHVGFTKLGLQRIIAEVHEDNVPALKNYQKAGFVIYGRRPFECGEGYNFEISISRYDFLALHSFLSEINLCQNKGDIKLWKQ